MSDYEQIDPEELLDEIPSHPNCRCFTAPDPHPWRSWWRRKLFPARICTFPDTVEFVMRDAVMVDTVVHLSWLDRSRMLFCGKLRVESRTICENCVGKTVSSSVAYVLPPWSDE